MKFPSVILGGVLCAAMLFSGACPRALAGSGRTADPVSSSEGVQAPAAPQSGTDAEAQAYEQREEQSPEVQEFAGGDVVVVGGGFILLVVLVVLIVLLLSD